MKEIAQRRDVAMDECIFFSFQFIALPHSFFVLL